MKHTLSIVTILSLSSLYASEFQPLGFQSIGIGGAGVASAKGSMAAYYNPALLAQSPDNVEVSLGVSLGVRDYNLGENIDTLSNLGLTNTLNRIAEHAPTSGTNTQNDRENIVQAQETLEQIGTNNGISAMPTAYLSTQVKNYAVGVFGTSDIAVSANVDSTHLDLSVENNGNYYSYTPSTDTYSTIDEDTYQASSLKYALDNGLTYLKAKGLVLIEVPVSYAHKFDTSLGSVGVGGSVKYMQGTTYIQTQNIDTDSNNAIDTNSLDQNQKDSSNIGLDLGMTFKPNKIKKLTVGLVAKNINAPEFDTVSNEKLTADMQLRTGILYGISDSLDFSGDLDLVENDTFIDGYKSQQLGGGIDYHPFSWISLRGGLMQNLANSNEGLVYSAGIGLGFKKFKLDVAGQMSNETGQFDGNDIPKYAKVNISLISQW